MSKREIKTPGSIFKWKGEVMEVVGISEGRVIYFRPIKAEPCEHCGEIKEIAIVEASPLFQENAEPVDTLIYTDNFTGNNFIQRLSTPL